jgi:hypothetical protein
MVVFKVGPKKSNKMAEVNFEHERTAEKVKFPKFLKNVEITTP